MPMKSLKKGFYNNILIEKVYKILATNYFMFY